MICIPYIALASVLLSHASAQIIVNLAVNKPAEQDTVEFGGVASRAADGNTNGDFGKQTVTHTLSGRNHYWIVDLEDNAAISEVVLYNRSILQSRLDDFTVEILDAEECVVDSRYFTTADEGSEIFSSKVFGFFEPVGRKVRITMETGVLSLAEVEVYGYPTMVTSSPAICPTATPTVVATSTPTDAPTATVTVSNKPTATPPTTLPPTKTSFVTTASPTDAPTATITGPNGPTATPSTTMPPTKTSPSQPSKTAPLLPSLAPSSKHVFQSREPSVSPSPTPIMFSSKAKKAKNNNKAGKSPKLAKSKSYKTEKAEKGGGGKGGGGKGGKSTKLAKSKSYKTSKA